MSEFLYVIAVGVPVSTAVCILASVIGQVIAGFRGRERRFDVALGGLPVLAVTALFGLMLVGLFN